MARPRISRELSLAVVISIALHAACLIGEAEASSGRDRPASEVTFEAEMLPLKAPLPKPEPVVAPNPANVPAEPAVHGASARAQPTSSRVLPAAAQAGKTLTASDDNDSQIADFTMVQGEGTSYIGGTTSAIGTAKSAVRGPVSNTATSVKRDPVASRIDSDQDRSRSATPTGSAWDCSRLYPSDPDAGDYATVLIAVSLGADGSPKRVALLRDPGHGFGAAAIRCAMGQRYNAAFDRQGNPVAATTPPITVRFTR